MARKAPNGEGTIFRRTDGLWAAQIYVDGKRKSKTSKLQKVVRDWLQEQRDAVSKGTFIETKDITLETYLVRYMEAVSPNLKVKTIDGYQTIIRKHINPALGKTKLTKLRADQVQAFYSAKLDEGLSNRTVAYIHSVLHKALDQAVKWSLVSRNVSDLTSPPTAKKPTLTTWTTAQAKEFLKFVADTRYYPIIALAYIGLRKGEILGLYVENFNKDAHTITVDHALQELSGKGVFVTEPKTSAGIRTIELPDFVYDALVEQVKHREGNQRFMFPSSTGNPISPRNFSTAFDRLLKRSGLPKIRFHDLRHFAISYLINELKIPPSVVQSIVGHASPLLTLSVYTHTQSEHQKEAMTKMSSSFKL